MLKHAVDADACEEDANKFAIGKCFFSLPWNSLVREALIKTAQVSIFPTLLIFDIQTGQIVTTWGRAAVQMQDERNFFLVGMSM